MSEHYTESQVNQIEQDAHDGAILEAGKEWERQCDEFNSREYELESRIAELEAECDRAKAIVSRLRDFLFDYTNLKISNSQDDRWWALVDKFDELTTESEK